MAEWTNVIRSTTRRVVSETDNERVHHPETKKQNKRRPTRSLSCGGNGDGFPHDCYWCRSPWEIGNEIYFNPREKNRRIVGTIIILPFLFISKDFIFIFKKLKRTSRDTIAQGLLRVGQRNSSLSRLTIPDRSVIKKKKNVGVMSTVKSNWK